MCLKLLRRRVSMQLFNAMLLLAVLSPVSLFAQAASQAGEPVGKAQPTRPVKVLRYFDPVSQVHVFTTDDDNAAKAQPNLQRESTVEGTPDSPFFYLATMKFPGMVPLYRFRSAGGSQQFVRTPADRAALQSKGLEELTQPVYVYRQPTEGASEIFSLTNPANGDQIYTTSKAELAYLTGAGWSQQPSVGYTQSTSSSGTGNLWLSTIKFDDDDLALLAAPPGDGSRLVFARTNAKIAKIVVGSMLYLPVEISHGPNGKLLLRRGFMRSVTLITHNGSELVLETTQARYKDLFHDVHIFLDGRPAAFAQKPTGTAAPGAMAAAAKTPMSPVKSKSFDHLSEFHEPEYLAQMQQPVPMDSSSASLSFSQDLNFPIGDGGINVVTLSGSLGAELTGEINYSAGCSDSIDLYFFSVCDQYTVSGTVLFTPSATASATADVNVGANFSVQKKVVDESETFEVEGIPVTVTFDLYVGASISDQATATFSASALARGTGGFSASLVVPEVWDSSASLIGCPNPCPDGFSCGGTDQGYTGGNTCSVTASANDNINLNPGAIDAKVWVTPEITAGPGLDDLSASATFSLENAIEFDITSSQVTGTYELTPSVGYDVGACIWGINVGYSGSTDLAELEVPIFTAGLPMGATMPPSQITLNSAVAAGAVAASDLPSQVYFLYGTSPTLAGAMQTPPQTCYGGAACNIYAPLSGLKQATTYYSEMVTQNILGSTMGGIMSFHVPTTQTITFPNPGNQTYGVPPIPLKATSTSGLPVTYTTIGPAVVQNNELLITGTGQVTVLADQAGNVDFIAATEVSVTFTVVPEAGSFGTVTVGQSSPVLPVSFTLAPGTKVGSVSVLTQGSPGLDYSGTQMGMSGNVFTVNVTFKPQAPGVREGAVVVYDTSTPANLLAAAFLSGVGTGPQIIFENSQQITTVASGFVNPFGVGVDGNGDVFVTEDQTSGGIATSYYGEVQEALAAGGFSTVKTLIGNQGPLYTPSAMTIDGSGNIWIADKDLRGVAEFLAPGYSTWVFYEGWNAAHTQSFSRPRGIAVDGAGNIYVADTGNNAVKEITAASDYVTEITLGSGFSAPAGLAVDSSGNVYVADTGNNAVKQIVAAGGFTTVNTLGSGFSGPTSVAVDAAGDVYVTDTGNNALKEIFAPGGYTTVQTIGSGFSAPNQVTLDGAGNVYVADTGNNAVKKLTFATPPSLSFTPTSVNATSANSPLTLTIANDGNEPLTFPYNPILPPVFPMMGASTCPELSASGSPAVLASGTSCSFVFDFVPTAPGPISDSLFLIDNTMNAGAPQYATQMVQLTGTGLFPATLTASVTALSKTYDGTTAAMVTGCSLAGVLPSDAGFVTCSVQSAAFTSPAVSSSSMVSATITLSGAAAGHYVLASPTATAMAAIAPATLTVTGASLTMPIHGTVPPLTFTYSGFVDGQGPSVVTTAPTCTTTATSSSVQGSYPIVCSGAVAPNYVLQYFNGSVAVSLGASFVATEFTLGSGFSSAGGVAVDATGNVYVVDTGNNALRELQIGNGYAMVTLATGFNAPGGVAVDSSGNVYVADTGNNAVKQILAAGGYKTITLLGSGFKAPTAVAVDASGNVYVADSGNNAVKQILAAGGYVTVNTLGKGFMNPTGVALDGSGDVFVADQGNSAVKEIVPAGGYITVNTLASGFKSPYGVALDNNWNVYVTDSGNGVLKELMAPSYTNVTPLAGGFSTAKGLALDSSGNVYVVSGGAATLQVIAYAPCFPTVTVGTKSLVYSYSFGFLSGGSITAPTVLTLGATGKDFADAGTGTCTTNGASHVYKPGDSCTVNVTFTPKHPGLRRGSVLLTNSSGSLVASALVSGTGSASQVTFTGSAAPTTLGSGFSNPAGVAVDGNGNVFVADTAHNAVKEVLASSNYATVKTIGSGFSAPTGVAVDGGGNVLVADGGNHAVKEILAVGGYTTVNTVGGGFTTPAAVAVDGTGNVFVADSGSSSVFEILWGGLTTTLGSGFSSPRGIAVDAAGNVFVADTGNKAVKEIVAAGGYATVNTLGSGFTAPTGVAVEAGGNLLVADTGSTTIAELVVTGGYTTEQKLGSGFTGPAAVAADASGDVFVVEESASLVQELTFSKLPALTFASTTVGQTSAAQTVTLENDGNATLLPLYTTNTTVPTITSGFVIVSGGTCAAEIAKGQPWLTPGESCTVEVAFKPQTGQSGKVTGTLTFTDNSVSGAPSTQVISLTGTAVAATKAHPPGSGPVAPSPSPMTE